MSDAWSVRRLSASIGIDVVSPELMPDRQQIHPRQQRAAPRLVAIIRRVKGTGGQPMRS
jgi:hypothetical protein